MNILIMAQLIYTENCEILFVRNSDRMIIIFNMFSNKRKKWCCGKHGKFQMLKCQYLEEEIKICG